MGKISSSLRNSQDFLIETTARKSYWEKMLGGLQQLISPCHRGGLVGSQVDEVRDPKNTICFGELRIGSEGEL